MKFMVFFIFLSGTWHYFHYYFQVFKCPNCSFWASTASRFHVHIVGHLNKKPFECSLCAYRSNWRWDITKHIRLKSARDVGHERARVLMTDETGRRNYSKYNKYLTLMRVHEPTAESSGSGRRTKGLDVSQGMALHSSVGILQQQLPAPPRLTRAPTPISSSVAHLGPGAPLRPPPPLRAAHNMVFPGPPPLQPQPSALLQQRQQQQEQEQQQQQKRQQNLDLDMKPKRALKRPAVKSGCTPEGQQPSKRPSTDSKKTLWKCKKCNYRWENVHCCLSCCYCQYYLCSLWEHIQADWAVPLTVKLWKLCLAQCLYV